MITTEILKKVFNYNGMGANVYRDYITFFNKELLHIKQLALYYRLQTYISYPIGKTE